MSLYCSTICRWQVLNIDVEETIFPGVCRIEDKKKQQLISFGARIRKACRKNNADSS